jgi:hypothetical protein
VATIMLAASLISKFHGAGREPVTPVKL